MANMECYQKSWRGRDRDREVVPGKRQIERLKRAREREREREREGGGDKPYYGDDREKSGR